MPIVLSPLLRHGSLAAVTSLALGCGDLEPSDPSLAERSATFDTLWDTTEPPPAELEASDTAAVNLGVRVQSSTRSVLGAIRFYRDPQAPTPMGTSVALWSPQGNRVILRDAGVGASGWITVPMPYEIVLEPDSTYTVSYFAPLGRYSATEDFFATPYASGPLTVPQNGGVYRYANESALPDQSYRASNYWIEPVLEAYEPSVPAGVRAHAGDDVVALRWDPDVAADALQISRATAVTGPYTVINPGGTIGNTFVDRDVENDTTYFYRINASVRRSGDVFIRTEDSSAVSATPTIGGRHLLWDLGTRPTDVAIDDTAAVELGVRVSSEVPARIGGVYFYRDAQAPHLGSERRVRVYTEDGTLLADETAIAEGISASGWLYAEVYPPIEMTPDAVYVVSALAPTGGYPFELEGFAEPQRSGPLTATAGVYAYGPDGGFPTQTYRASNYWIQPEVYIAP